jgi:hypothetical protein
MKKPPDPRYRHRFPAELISHAVWLYHVFSLSFRDVELLLLSVFLKSRTPAGSGKILVFQAARRSFASGLSRPSNTAARTTATR